MQHECSRTSIATGYSDRFASLQKDPQAAHELSAFTPEPGISGPGVDPTLQTKVITFSFYGDLTCGWGTAGTKKQKRNKGRKKQRLELHIA